MNQSYWQKQLSEKPIYPNLLWSKPETKRGAGKLLIIGGQAEDFSGVAETFAAAEKAGAGSIRVIMPDSTEKFTRMLPNIEYAPANSSGSFSKLALAELLDASNWADIVLLAGDLGKNSETSLMLESFINKTAAKLAINDSSLSSLNISPKELFNGKLIICGLSSLQKLLISLPYDKPLTSKIGDVDLAEILNDLTTKYDSSLVMFNKDVIWSAHSGNVSSTVAGTNKINLAAFAAVWVMQQPTKEFEALTCAAYELSGSR